MCTPLYLRAPPPSFIKDLLSLSWLGYQFVQNKIVYVYNTDINIYMKYEICCEMILLLLLLCSSCQMPFKF